MKLSNNKLEATSVRIIPSNPKILLFLRFDAGTGSGTQSFVSVKTCTGVNIGTHVDSVTFVPHPQM